MNPQGYREQFHIKGEELVEKVKSLIHEGNVTHLVIKHDEHTIMEVPVNLGVVAIVVAPVLAAVAAVGASLTHCTVEVVRTEPPTAL